MESYAGNLIFFSLLLLGGSVLFLQYIVRVFRTRHQDAQPTAKHTKNERTQSKDKKDEKSGKSSNNKKKLNENRWVGRGDKQSFRHPWLVSTLKGHTGEVLDMDFSSNGKYLASCADEDPDPGGEFNSEDTSSTSSSDSNKENSRPASLEPSPRTTKGLSRRQRKNRRRDDNSPPDNNNNNTTNNNKKKPSSGMQAKSAQPPPTSMMKPILQEPSFNHSHHMADLTFVAYLRNYLLMKQHFIELGYPIDSDLIEGFQAGKVLIYKAGRGHGHVTRPVTTQFDVNAREFVPRYVSSSGSSSSDDSEPEVPHRVYKPKFDRVKDVAVERKCVRCNTGFFTTQTEYLTQEHCLYHHGRLREFWRHGRTVTQVYSCCQGKRDSKGCTLGQLHVWSGIEGGLNGPYSEFVRTKARRHGPPPGGSFGVYALDCEMCYTVQGLELTKISVISRDGRIVYDTLVKPENEIIDYNTRFSGITAKDFQRRTPKSLKEVQNDLMGFISAQTILIGHSLENDLKALKMVHYAVVDTSVAFPHNQGLPYRHSLKYLSNQVLKRNIQCSEEGHDSYEDAKACMDLMLWLVRRDMRTWGAI